MPQTVTLQQIAKRAARRHALVAHGGEDENLIERQPFGENPIEPHIGKDAAGETEMPRLVAPQQPLDRAQHGVFQNLLDRGRGVFPAHADGKTADGVVHVAKIAEIRAHAA